MNRNRINRILEIMRDQGLSQIIVSSTASVYYITGLWVEPHERMLALLLDDTGQATMFGNVMFGLPEDIGIPVVLHSDKDDPVAQLAASLRPGTVGIDKHWYSKFLLGLMAHRGDVRPVEGSAPVDIARKCKDEVEQKAMRYSSRMNDEVMAECIGAVKNGIKEHELASLINSEYRSRGADCQGPQIVCFGPNGADPHHTAGGAALKPGDSIVFDIFAPIGRYWCDMTRTVFYKTASEIQREVYYLVRRANEAAIAEARPGVTLSYLDKIARDIITDGGYGPNFIHRLGHGCGLDGHEPPDVSAASHGILEPGMIFSIEPGIYLPDEFGVRIEDLVLVTEYGCEVLNHYPKDMQIIE